MIRKIISNISWLTFDKIFRLGVGGGVFIWQARYLGPDDYGMFNFSIAIIMMISVITGLGVNNLVVKDLIDGKIHEKVILGTSFFLKTIISIVFFILSLVILNCFFKQYSWYSITYILCFSLLFSPANIIKYFFESKTKSKYTVIIENSIFFIAIIIKVLLIYNKYPLIYFVYLYVLESFFVSVFYILFFCIKEYPIFYWSFSLKYAKELLKNCWPLVVSSMAWVVYTRIDQVMIGNMIGSEAVGYYSAAIRISDIINFIPTVIILSAIPTITKIKQLDNIRYLKLFQSVYDLSISIVFIFVIIISIFSFDLISVLYGEAYLASSSVLTLQVFSILFSTMAVISGRYLLNENLQHITMLRHLMGCVINIILNLILIPIYGINGAAIASLISLFMSNFVFDIIDIRTRICFFQKLKALIFYNLFLQIKKGFRCE